MKKIIKLSALLLFCIVPLITTAQTQTRDNAGLQGDAGAVSGFFETFAPVNYPAGASSWWHLLDVRHSNYNNNFAMQFAGSFFNQELYFRKTVNDPSQPWSRILMETNGSVYVGSDAPENHEGWQKVFGIKGSTDAKALVSTTNIISGIWSHENGFYGAPAGGITGTYSDHPFSIITGKTTKMTVLNNGNVGIGTTNPTALLQIGDFNSSNQAKQLLIPGVYNFERVQLGQLGNGNAALEMINHNSQENSYGVKITTNVDNGGPGLQFQYAKSKSSYEALEYQTAMFLDLNGHIGIGTFNPQEKLTVAGTIGAREIKVSTNAGADFVFEPTYKLPDLNELEKFVKTNKHLPEIPTAKQMVENGVNLGELNIKLLQKVEELTLYLIEKDKKIDALIQRVEVLEYKSKTDKQKP